MKMMCKVLTIVIMLTVVLTTMPMMNDEVYARGNTGPEVMISGDTEYFIKDAPVSTIRIDSSKIRKDNLVFTEPGKLDQLPNAGTAISFTFEDGYAYAEGVTVNADYKRLGNFTFVYKDAAVMRDGTKRNLEVIFDDITVIRQSDRLSYDNEKIRIAYAGDPANGMPLALTPFSVNNVGKHFAIRSEIKFRVGKAGDISAEEESFLFTAGDININNSSENIVNDYGNQHYSESIEPMYGINSESDIYLPSSTNVTDNPSGSWNKTSGGYGYRFMVNSNVADPSSDPYDYGLAIVARAGGSNSRINNGFITRAWASSVPNYVQSKIYFMNFDLTNSFTSSSGSNGKIELWSDGCIHDTDAEENNYRRLDGGTATLPYSYEVPHGKEVAYKMTPDKGYVLDSLTVNGAAAEPTKIVYKDDSSTIDHYEYTFGNKNVDENNEIKVTWKNSIEPSPAKVGGTLMVKMTAKGKTKLAIGWNKINGVAGYDIFFAKCGKKLKNVKTIKGNKTFKWTKAKLKKGKSYMATVKAYVMKDGKKQFVSKSPVMYAYTGNGNKKFTNAKAVKVKKAKVTLKKGRTFKIKAHVTKVKKGKKLMPKKYVATVRYLSTNKKVATVSKSGKIKAAGKGTCEVYAYAHNGVCKKVTVTVK